MSIFLVVFVECRKQTFKGNQFHQNKLSSHTLKNSVLYYDKGNYLLRVIATRPTGIKMQRRGEGIKAPDRGLLESGDLRVRARGGNWWSNNSAHVCCVRRLLDVGTPMLNY